MSLEIEVQNAINANLPAQVGDILKKRLEQADKDAKSLNLYKEQCIEVTNQRDAANRLVSELQGRVSAFESREADLVKREKAITELELTAKFEKEKTQVVLGMFGTVFQNRTVREESLKQMPGQSWQPGSQGPNIWNVQAPESRTVTES